MKKKNFESLKKSAFDLRIKTLLAFIKKGEAHLGGSFSIIETITFLYNLILRKEDRFILSKSHASFPLVLTLRKIRAIILLGNFSKLIFEIILKPSRNQTLFVY